MDLQHASRDGTCPWLLAAARLQPSMELALDMQGWQLVSSIRRPADANDNVLLYRKIVSR